MRLRRGCRTPPRGPVPAAASGALPRWLRYTGIALAIAITAPGIAYLLLLQGLTVLAAPALVLLLLFITGTGITVGAAKTTAVAAVSAGTPVRQRGPADAPASR